MEPYPLFINNKIHEHSKFNLHLIHCVSFNKPSTRDVCLKALTKPNEASNYNTNSISMQIRYPKQMEHYSRIITRDRDQCKPAL